MQIRDCVGAILSGGKGRRMGASKADLVMADGQTMLAHTMAPLREVCGRIVIVGGPAGACRGCYDDVTHLADRRPGGGPLGGVETLLASGLANGYLVAACDQPLLTPEILRLLMEGDPALPHFFRQREQDRLDPFPGYFPASLCVAAERARAGGISSMHGFIAGISAVWIPLPDALRHHLQSVNTPAAFAQINGAAPDGEAD